MITLENINEKIKYNDKKNLEIKKLASILSKIKIKNLNIKITNTENIVDISFEDSDYKVPGRGFASIGMVKQDMEQRDKKCKDGVSKGLKLIKKSKIDFEDIWSDNNSIGGVLANYYN